MTSKRSPTREMVAEIIVTEMAKWSIKDNELQRRDQLFEMCDRLIRYFEFYDSALTYEVLPGLPGGKKLG